ncbi:tRNA (adenosine(37)-N6)-threonylcarbamoyltransferase complex transferase subunit TsaD, partial [bacterium]
MLVLGIETSCDETAASVVKDGREVLSSVVSSSLDFHKKYGGVIPEIAFRMQLETIAEVVECAFRDAKTGLKEVKAISVTNTPGLSGSLAVGISFAKSLSLSQNLPLLGVNHLYGHIYASFLNRDIPKFPFISLIVSGGHTSLFLLRDFDDITLLGSTNDDACGEAF